MLTHLTAEPFVVDVVDRLSWSHSEGIEQRLVPSTAAH